LRRWGRLNRIDFGNLGLVCICVDVCVRDSLLFHHIGGFNVYVIVGIYRFVGDGAGSDDERFVVATVRRICDLACYYSFFAWETSNRFRWC
jgi:hypothetical protein